ncbi:MAG: hypothetical protein E7633_06295 [Ruminococcaceae bacterium]|nr:hypothetical protein [Oscillospiraceae bacterium]
MPSYQILQLIYSNSGATNDFQLIADDEVVKASLTSAELNILFAVARALKNTNTFADFLRVCIGIKENTLMAHYGVSLEQIRRWKHDGIDDCTKQLLACAILSDYLMAMRYHICDCCGKVYFSADRVSGQCKDCELDSIGEGSEWDV